MTLDGPLIDALLEHGITDKQLALLKNLDAVEYLLEMLHDEHDGDCIGCGADNFYGRRDAHARDCKVMLARIAIGQHTLEAELGVAEDDARREHARRSAVSTLERRRGGSITVQSSPFVRNGEAFVFDARGLALNAALYADTPLLSLLPDRPPTTLPLVHQSGGANNTALCGAALDNNPGSTVNCPDCLKRLYGPGTVGR